MRRIFLIMISCMVLIMSCQKPPVELTVSSPSVSFNADASTESITISSNYPWEISCMFDWFSPSRFNGEPGLTTIELTCRANNSFVHREGILTITSEGAVLKVNISQEGRILSLLDIADGLAVDFKEQDVAMDVSSTGSYVCTSSAGWIRFVETKAPTRTTSVFHIDRNTQASPRSAEIEFKSGKSTSRKVRVTQAAGPVLQLMDSHVEFESYGGGVRLNMDCSAVPDMRCTDGRNWLSLEGTPEEGFTLRASENPEPESRETDVIFVLEDLSDTLHVIQSGLIGDPFVDLSGKTGATVSADGGMVAFEVYSNTSLEFPENLEWAEIKTIERDGSRYKVCVEILPYEITEDVATAFDERVWEMHISDANHRVSCTYTITQTPAAYHAIRMKISLQEPKEFVVELSGDSPSGCIKVAGQTTVIGPGQTSVNLEPDVTVEAEIRSRGADAVKFRALDKMRIILGTNTLERNNQ